MNCTSIGVNVAAAICDKTAKSGTGKRTIIMNYDDIDHVSSTMTNNIISGIVLKSGKIGYTFTSHGDSTLGEATLKKGTYVNSWVHNTTLRVFTKEEVNKAFINSLAGAKVVVIVENNEIGTNGAVKYEVYGWDSGLELSEGTTTTEMQDGVVATLKLSTNDKSTEGTIPKSFFNTDITTTETAINALVA